MSVIIFIFILLILVLVHELGHFIFAKRAGVRVDEFGFGYPPRAVKLFTWKGTLFTLNWLPFGGFVKIFGENPDPLSMSGPDKESALIHKPRYVQALVLFAGILFNIILAWILFSVGFMSGMPTSAGAAPAGVDIRDPKLLVVDVVAGSPAAEAGLQTKDQIISLATETETVGDITVPAVQSFISSHGDTPITVTYVRDNDVQTVSITPKTGISSEPDTAVIGINMDFVGTVKLSVPRALWEGAKLTVHVLVATVVQFYTLIHDAISGKGSLDGIAGPVGIVGIVGTAYEFGIIYLLSFTALISINLAIINLIPFPALDGGRLFFLLIEAIKGSRINPKIGNIVNLIGFGLLILLMLFVTYHDIVNLIKNHAG